MALSVSIIVPVYNCGAMFSPCLQSLREQTLTDFEVILVNNGSTDGSAALAERTAAEDNRFHVIHHPHGGAGECRNVGIAAVFPQVWRINAANISLLSMVMTASVRIT